MVVQPKLYTTSEFEEFINRPENADRRFELVHGEIVEKMPTEEHGLIALNIGTWLNLYLYSNPIGRAAVEARHHPTDDDHNDRIPDVSVVLDMSKPVTREGAANYLPDLAVEIKSPTQSYKEMTEKADFYLNNGTKLVWLVYPERRLVEVLTHDSRDLVGEDGTLTGGDLLPGLSVAVKDVFRGV